MLEKYFQFDGDSGDAAIGKLIPAIAAISPRQASRLRGFFTSEVLSGDVPDGERSLTG